MTTGRINQVSIVGTLAAPGDGGAQPQPLSRADAFVFAHGTTGFADGKRVALFGPPPRASLHAPAPRSR